MRRGLTAQVAVVRQLYEPLGGPERFAGAALAALRSRGASVTFVSRRWPDTDGTALSIDPPYVGALWRDWGFSRALRAALRGRHFDLVQAHEALAPCDVLFADAGVLRERFARTASGLGRVHRSFLAAAELEALANPRLRTVICQSEMVRGEFARHYGAAREKFELIRPAVDRTRCHPGLRTEMRAAVRQQLRLPPAANVVLHIGNDFERTGVDTLLAAIASVPEERWAIVAGTDPRSQALAARARSLGIGDRVRFAGAVSDPRPYYAAADAFALAARYDPFPHAALEAMACGLPVVTTRQCGIAELLREGETGFVREALDTAGLAGALAQLDIATSARLGANAADAVAGHTPEALTAQCAALYDRLLTNPVGP